MIFITGDTHGAIGKDADKLLDEKLNNLNRTDYVIVTGDFGFIFSGSDKELSWLKILKDKPYTILFIDGNHENFERLYSYPIETWNGGKVHIIAENIIHLMRGQVFNINGKKFFTFGGATSVDIGTRSEFIDWWSQELPTTSELNEGIDNLEKNNWDVDYVLSHCCSSNTLKTVMAFGGFKHDYGLDVLNKYFDFLEENLKYKHWYFGHYHLDIKHIETNKTAIYQNLINVDKNEDEILIYNHDNDKKLCIIKNNLNYDIGGKVFWCDDSQIGDDKNDDNLIDIYVSNIDTIPFRSCSQDEIIIVNESQTEVLQNKQLYIKSDFFYKNL